MSASTTTPSRNPLSARKILIVGGGIGGLTLATALAGGDHRVEVVEIDPEWPTVGWGLSLTGPALRALSTLGLTDACVEAGYGIVQVVNNNSKSETMRVGPLPRLSGPDQPAQAGIARPMLHQVLRGRAEELGTVLRRGLSVTALDEGADGVKVTFTDGSEGTYDLVVGADGVRSQVRSLIGVDGVPEYTGQMVWRALVDRPEWATSLNTYADPDYNSGLIPISDKQAYVFMTENAEAISVVADEQLADEMRDRLARFSGQFSEVWATITDPGTVVRRPVHVLIADAPWHRGRTVLIGDAVHSPSPQMVSGAALAIEDAVVLSDLLGTIEGDWTPAALDTVLTAFAARRHERCALVVASSLRMSELDRQGDPVASHGVQAACFGALAAPI
jgi:2-polyprenyl-6-methoxyphenol hydroxylase-like FAD-dependent oxidoreductase